MRMSRVIGAAVASLLCTAVVSAPAFAAPPPADTKTSAPTDTKTAPAPAPAAAPASTKTGQPAAYQLGTYAIKLSADCKSGTVTLAGWDSRAAFAGFTTQTSTQPSKSYSDGVESFSKGAATIAVKDSGEGLAVPVQVHYNLIISGENNSVIAVYAGDVACSAGGQLPPNTTAAQQPVLNVTTTCAKDATSGAINVAITNPNAATVRYRVRAFTEASAWASLQTDPYTSAYIEGGATKTVTVGGLAAGEWLVYVGSEFNGAVFWFGTTTAIDIATCAATTPVTTKPITPTTTAVAKPGLAETGVRA